jgi:predicted nucleic acid-binding protein
MIVVDTNVTCELMKPAPFPAVVGWVRDREAADLFTTAITRAEIARDRAAALWHRRRC